MDETQKASERILSLKRTLKYNEKQLLKQGIVYPVIKSVRKRAKRFYHFAILTASFIIILSIIRVAFAQVSFISVLFSTGFGIFLAYFVRTNYNHIEKTLVESESLLKHKPYT